MPDREIYVTGHRNPDLDSIASAIGYAELKRRLDRDNRYVAARLGEVNSQTEWALRKSGADAPTFLPHIRLRARDVMHHDFATATQDTPIREVGLTMAQDNVDLVPILDSDGTLVGLVTEKNLARRYIRESQGASDFSERPVRVSAIVETIQGELLQEGKEAVDGRLWVVSMDAESMGGLMEEGDIIVVGNRADAQRQGVEIGVALLVLSNGTRPEPDLLELAKQRGTAVVVTPLDSYVASRMLQLSVACRTLMTSDPLTAEPDDLVSELTPQILEVDYRAAVVLDEQSAPLGLVSRRSLINPARRRVLLVDHAETAQSVPGVETAEIVEILDHHHIGSVETTVPVTATFDPIGSTATLVVERFRMNGMEPSPAAATMLLGAILSDTVILSSPTTTERDRGVVRYLELLLQVDATRFGTEMFEASSDVAAVPAEDIIARDAKEYEVGGRTICIAQIETVGHVLLERTSELLEALERARSTRGYALYALMVTDIVDKGTKLLVAGEKAPVQRAFSVESVDGVLDLPGVMSRKKQVAPKLLTAF
jgi:manganese-dependent inorganic pyrophosphatase